MSTTMNQSDKSMKSVKNTEAVISRRLTKTASENAANPLEQALRARAMNQDENFSILGRLLAVN